MAAQIEGTRPLAKRLWQAVVRAKIVQQGAVLESLGRPSGGFHLLSRKVKSGDPENVEAQAARRYWPLIMGPEFRRDPDLPGVNGMLNYAYTVLRAGTARAVMAAGLHPAIGIHHRGPHNTFRLADDLMEPFRPIADLLIRRLTDDGATEVTPETKKAMAALPTLDMATAQGTTPLGTCLQRLATSLARAYETREAELDLPIKPLPLDFADPPKGTSGAESEVEGGESK
jgi:CRISPR-associated protein Cas1